MNYIKVKSALFRQDVLYHLSSASNTDGFFYSFSRSIFFKLDGYHSFGWHHWYTCLDWSLHRIPVACILSDLDIMHSLNLPLMWHLLTYYPLTFSSAGGTQTPSIVCAAQWSFFYNSSLIGRMHQQKNPKNSRGWTQITCLAVNHSNHYTRMFSVLVWGSNLILFMHGWFCPIRLIHLIGRKFYKNSGKAAHLWIEPRGHMMVVDGPEIFFHLNAKKLGVQAPQKLKFE